MYLTALVHKSQLENDDFVNFAFHICVEVFEVFMVRKQIISKLWKHDEISVKNNRKIKEWNEISYEYLVWEY